MTLDKKKLVIRIKLLFVLTVFVILLGLIGYLITQHHLANGVSVDNAQSLIKQGAIIIDLSSLEEYETGHIENSLNIPYDGCWVCFEEVITTFPREQVFLLYQNSGHERAHEVALQMETIQFTSVYFLIDGYQAWIREQI